MRLARRIAALVVLPLAAALHTGGWYSARALFAIYLMDAGQDLDAWRWFWGASSGAAAVGVVVGAALTGLVGPAAAAALGLFGVSVALGAQGMVPVEALAPVALIGAVAHGVARPTLPAAIGAPLTGWDSARIGAQSAATVLVNLGTTLAAGVAGLAYTTFGGEAVPPFAAGAVLALFAAALTALVAALDVLPDDGPTEDAPTTAPAAAPPFTALGGAVLLAVPLSLGWIAWTTAVQVVQQQLYLNASYAGMYPLHAINPIAASLTAGGVAIVAVAAQVFGLRVPVHALMGLGFVLIGAPAAVALIPSSLGSLPLLIVAIAVQGLGEGLLTGALLARMTTDLPWRAAALPLAIVFLPDGLRWLVFADAADPGTVAVAASALLCLGLGFALALAEVPLGALAVRPPADADGA